MLLILIKSFTYLRICVFIFVLLMEEIEEKDEAVVQSLQPWDPRPQTEETPPPSNWWPERSEEYFD